MIAVRWWFGLALIVWGSVSIAAAGEAAKPALSPGLGQLLIQDTQSGSPVRLNVARYHVHVVLQPPVALVQIDQSFYNPFNQQQEGQFVFNLPPGASVSRFAMYVSPTQLIEGELVECKRAAEIYQSIVSRRRDPAILEQLGDNLFKMRVFPIFARDEKRILLDFTLPLEPQSGQYQFRLPLLSDLMPIWDFRVSGAIRGAVQPQSAACVSHSELKFQARDDGGVEFALHKKNYRPETDLVLTFAEQADRPATLRSYVAEPLPAQQKAQPRAQDSPPPDPWSQRAATFFLAEIPPAGPAEPAAPPTDVLVLADTSSSITDLGAVRRTVCEVVQSLRPKDRVRLLCVDVAGRPLHAGWLKPSDAAALEGLDQEFCLGKTDLDACLRQAVKEFDGPAGKRRRLIIYVGDGADEAAPIVDPAGKRLSPEWLDESGATLVAVGTQRTESKTDYLRSLVAASGGLRFDLAGDVRAANSLTRWLGGGLPLPDRVVDAAVEGASAEDLFYASAWLPGEPLYIYGRMPEAGEVKLRLTLGRGKKMLTRDWAFPVIRREDDVFVGRLWAQRRLEQLRRLDQQQEETRKAIIALSQEWSLLSPHTAFLVLESEQDYPRWGLDRRVRRRYWKPAEARPEAPLPANWVEQFQRTQQAEHSPDEFLAAMQAAREALTAKDYAQAHRQLRAVAGSPRAAQSDDFRKLRQQTLEGLRTQTLAKPQGLRRGLLDPAATDGWQDWQPSVTTLLGSSFHADPEFMRRHPYAERLLQRVDMATFAQGQTLEQLAAQLADLTGVNVRLDRRALDDMGVDLDERFQGVRWQEAPPTAAGIPPGDPFGPAPAHQDPLGVWVRDSEKMVRRTTRGTTGRISLRSGTRHILRQSGLVLVEETQGLLITTPEEAELRLTTEVYPVVDLFFTDRTSPPWLLTHPYLDRQVQVRERLESKLKRPVTIECLERPLTEVLWELAGKLDDTFLIDSKSLDDIGVDPQTPVTALFREVPAKQALEWILGDLGLDYTLDNEALTIMTPEEAESQLEIRVHSGRDLVYEYPVGPSWQRPGFGWPMSGGMMGSGGGGAMTGGFGGGMGGSFGGGMGGMGGMAGMGGGMGGSAAGAGLGSMPGGTNGSSVGLSTGGDAEAAPADPPGQASATGPDAELSAAGPSPAANADPLLEEEQYSHDSDAVIDLITSTIAPQTWDAVGGPGSIDFFPYSLDLVFGQTREVHERVEELLDRLRRLPPEIGLRSGGRPATIPPLRQVDPAQADFDSLIDLITSTVQPQAWDTVGGPGGVEAEPTRMALVVSQSSEMHDEVAKLLTILRRHRYEALHGSRPWESSSGVGLRPVAAVIEGDQGDDQGTEPARLSDYPEGQRAEFEALLVRREPVAGQWQWRRVESTGAGEQIALRLAGARLQCELPTCTVRTEGDEAAVAWPGLRLVELGNYAEGLRRAVDVRLPWLPHRSNTELARLFDVSEVTQKKADGSGDPSYEDAVWLRMVPVGLARDGGTYLQIAYSRVHGLPIAWESYVGGKLTARIRFSGPTKISRHHAWRTAVQEDAQGRGLTRWELVAYQAKAGAIPAPTEPWSGCLHLDRRAARPAIDAALAEALTALREFDWAKASEELSLLPDDRARHPLVRLLQAWCLENDPRLGTHDRLVGHLLEVAQSNAPDLRRFVAEGNFPSLVSGERYAILSLQPAATRTAQDCDRLADASVAAGKQQEALQHVEAALSRGGVDGREDQRRRRCVELLLRLDRAADAVAAAQLWAAGLRRQPHELAAMAELLASHAQQVPAEQLFGKALADGELAAADRYALLRRWAAIRTGVARCEKLIEAAALKPSGSQERRQCVDLLRRELATAVQADTAGHLAARTADAELAGELVFRQAELTPDASQAALLLWKLYEAQRLNAARLPWACQTWNLASQGARVIGACEAELRAGRRLSPATAAELAVAYRAEYRDLDAKRAGSSSAESVPAAAPAVSQPGQTGSGGFF